MKFPIVELPEYYSGLLKLNIPSIDRATLIVPAYVEKHQHLGFLIRKHFQDINKQGHISPILKSLGWQTFRGRLCSLFIYRQANGSYPEVLTSDFSRGVGIFEKKIASSCVSGFSRGYLFGFYLKMARIHTNSSEEFNFLTLSQEHLDLLSYMKVKVVQIDWLLMLLIHFSYFFGIDTLKEELRKDTKFKTLYEELSQNEKELLVENMLAYGASINDSDTFAGMFA